MRYICMKIVCTSDLLLFCMAALLRRRHGIAARVAASRVSVCSHTAPLCGTSLQVYLSSPSPLQSGGRVGARAGRAAHQARPDLAAAGTHQGAAVRAVLRLVPRREPPCRTSRPLSRPAWPRPRPAAAPAQQAHQAQEGGSLPRAALVVLAGGAPARGDRRRQTQAGPQTRRRLVLALRPVVSAPHPHTAHPHRTSQRRPDTKLLTRLILFI